MEIVRQNSSFSKPLKITPRGCSEEAKKKFKSSSCAMKISVGQEAHENEKLEATLNFVNERFNKCTILVNDSLQRHTMALRLGKHPDELYEKSILEGDLWIERNRKYYGTLNIPYNIIRWDHWLTHKNFKKYLLEVNDLYEKDSSYREAFYMDANKFIERLQKNSNGSYNEEVATGYSLAYLKEESAIMRIWAEEENFHFTIYPQRRLHSMAATYDRFIVPTYPDLLHPISFRFKTNLSSQNFYALAKAS